MSHFKEKVVTSEEVCIALDFAPMADIEYKLNCAVYLPNAVSIYSRGNSDNQ
jgi:hypothetical protein